MGLRTVLYASAGLLWGGSVAACDLRLDDLESLLAARQSQTDRIERTLNAVEDQLRQHTEIVNTAFSDGKECPDPAATAFNRISNELRDIGFADGVARATDDGIGQDEAFACLSSISARLERATEKAVIEGNALRVQQLGAVGSRLLRLDGKYTKALSSAKAADLRGVRLSRAALQYSELCVEDVF